MLRPFRHPQQTTLALGSAAIAEVAHAASLAVAGHVAGAPGVQLGSALTRCSDLPDPLADIVALDDRRMTIEAQCRDPKGCRFGVRWEWARVRTPPYLARVLLLVGITWVLWTAVGHAMAEARPSVRLRRQRKGPRPSLRRVGVYDLSQLARRGRASARFVQPHLPRPQLRCFAWLQAGEGTS